MSPASRTSLLADPAAWAWVLTAAGLVLAVALAAARPERGLWGDEGTYLAMTASLVRDGDLRFAEPDREWVLEAGAGPPATVILQRTPAGITYSKPVLYPLLAAPFSAVLGERGPVALNLLATLAALGVAWRFLRRLGPRAAAALTLGAFFFCSVVPFYLGWRMSDSVQVAFCLAGLALAAGALRRDRGHRALAQAAVAGLLLGLVASMRYPGAALAAGAVLGAIWCGRYRRGLALAAAAVVGFAAASGAGALLTGAANPYKAERSGFSATTGYPIGPDAAEARRFATHPATQSAGLKPRLDWTRSGYSALYYLVGRHTGVLPYFPAALALLAAVLRRPDRLGLALLTGPAAMVLFYLLWMPENYYGGSTCFGNRYFLVAYPALLAALPRLPSARWLAGAWLIGLVAAGSGLASIRAAGDAAGSSQSHAGAGLFRLLPGETTAQKLDGLRARYWSRDFVRFADRFAEVGEDSFRLTAGAAATELQVAFRRPRKSLHLLVEPSGPGTELRWRDWSGGGRLGLEPGPRVIEVPLSPTWRWHTYWWRAPDVYQVRTVRLALDAPGGGAATAEIRYLGDGALALLAPVARRASLELVGRPAAGARSAVRVRARNVGRGLWPHAGPLPVAVRLTLAPADGADPGTEILEPLPGDVAVGSFLDLTLELAWPAAPGDYRLEAELVRPALPGRAVPLVGRAVAVPPGPAARGGGGAPPQSM